MKLTRDEFKEIYDQGFEATFAFVEQLLRSTLQQVEQLDSRVQQLEIQKNKDSHNSSKPPSTDGLQRPPRSLRTKTGKKPGGQQGHPGHTLDMVAEADEYRLHTPATCSHCGHCLADAAPVDAEEAQVFDLPPLRPVVTSHLRLHVVCPGCQHLEKGTFPTGIRPGTQYGAGVKALATYLLQAQLLPYERTAECLHELFHLPVSQAALGDFLQDAYARLAGVEEAIKKSLASGSLLHVDETGMRIQNKLHWFHTASTSLLTFYAPHAKRGEQALSAIAILPGFEGTAVHDAWAPYLKYACRHGLCNAHLLRELIGLQEASPKPWIPRMLRFLLGLKRRVARAKAAGRTGLSPPELNRYLAVYARLIAIGLKQNPPILSSGKRGRIRQSAAYNLLRRLDVYRAFVLAFALDFAVPFDNNQAERDLRMVKLRQKISGCFRSTEGASWFCRIRGYISTLRKQGRSVLAALNSLFNGKPIMPTLVPG